LHNKQNHPRTECAVLDTIIEQAETVPVTAAVIFRAMRAYSCLTKNGDSVDLPRTRIVRRRSSVQPQASSLQRLEHPEPNRNAAIRKSAKSMKTNAKSNL